MQKKFNLQQVVSKASGPFNTKWLHMHNLEYNYIGTGLILHNFESYNQWELYRNGNSSLRIWVLIVQAPLTFIDRYPQVGKYHRKYKEFGLCYHN